jgi:ABC-type bacteriocin/lantibiotic exporter with double-glycine peptidase domain
MTRVPFRWQHNDWTCGPATLAMALASFGVQVEPRRLVRTLGANPRTGTSRASLARGARGFGFRTRARHHRTLAELERDLRGGMVVIVLYREPDGEEAHYAILLRVTKTMIRLQDPWNGPYFSLPRKEFIRRWHGTYRKWPCWALTISRKAKPEA